MSNFKKREVSGWTGLDLEEKNQTEDVVEESKMMKRSEGNQIEQSVDPLNSFDKMYIYVNIYIYVYKCKVAHTTLQQLQQNQKELTTESLKP